MRDNMDEIPSGGIGIKLLAIIADELSYTRTSEGRRNSLLIVKYFQTVPPQHSTKAGFSKRHINVLNSFNWLPEQRTRQSDRSSNQPIQKISLQVNTDIKAVAQVLSWVEQLEYLPIPEAVFQQCKLAAIEGFTNAVRHAHKNLPLETPIELEITVFNERLEIKIWDLGKFFDFQAKLKEDLPEESLFSWNEQGFTTKSVL
ncbi:MULTISPECIES: ATP-binding protein [unclassified Microcoleus]|uniref:ATP-binding protein n=1 Tax=unclassified Microcoleus TaxID=2642155 RepID=UPI002FD49EE4